MNTRARQPKSEVEGVFKLNYPSRGSRKRQCQNDDTGSRSRNNSVSFASPQPQRPRRNVESHHSAKPGPAIPASPAFNQRVFPLFKQSTPMQAKKGDRKRESPMKSAAAYKTPEKKKRIYDSDEEELEFSPSGRRMPIAERRVLLQNATQWSARVDQEERFQNVYQKSVERLKRRILSESMQSIDTRSDISSCSDFSEASLDMSQYELDEETLTRRQKQIAYGKNTEEYEFFARQVDKMSRTRKDPNTPDKFDKISRRRFDGRVKAWKLSIYRWYEQFTGREQQGNQQSTAPRRIVPEAVQVTDENTVTLQGDEGTMTGAPKARSSPLKETYCAMATSNVPVDESAVDAFQSPAKSMTCKTTNETHTELTCDLQGFAICSDSQSTLTGPTSSYQTRSRARLVFS